jgi:hypothetical protein
VGVLFALVANLERSNLVVHYGTCYGTPVIISVSGASDGALPHYDDFPTQIAQVANS